MKKIILFVSFCITAQLLLAQDLKNYIPESASYIVKVNGARINKNVNFEEIRATEMYKDFIFKILNNKTAEERAIITLFETPDETGLNIKTDMYVYDIPYTDSKKVKPSKKNKDDFEIYDDNINSSTPKTITVGALTLLNNKKFSIFISNLLYKNTKSKISKVGKSLFYIKDNSSLIIWTTEKVFLCYLPYVGYDKKDYTKSDIIKIIKTVAFPLPSKSIVNNTHILNGLGIDSDISYAFNSTAWSKNPWLFKEFNRSSSIKDTTLFNEELFKDNYSFSYVNFENGKFMFSGNQFYGKKLANIFNPIFNLKPSTTLANILYQTPVTSYISYAFSFSELKKLVDKTFNYNMDTLLIEFIKDNQTEVFETDSLVRIYRKEIDTINFIVKGPNEEMYLEKTSTTTDSGTVHQDSDEDIVVEPYDYDASYDEVKYNHKSLNWYEIDSLELRQDTLYTLIENRKDTLAVKTYKKLGIHGDDLWSIFNGEFIFLYHAMTSIEKKYQEYEMDAEYNYVAVEKTKTIPMPLYSFAASINDVSLFNKYLNIMIQKGFIQKEKDRYLIILGDINQYIWVNDKNCILTNDNNFNPSKRKNTTTRSTYEMDNVSRITTNQSGAYVEVGKILASSVQFVDDKQTAELLEILAKYFDETIYTNNFVTDANVVTQTDILFNDTSKNSINILIEMMDELYVHFKKK
jgi:hypothetical protein